MTIKDLFITQLNKTEYFLPTEVELLYSMYCKSYEGYIQGAYLPTDMYTNMQLYRFVSEFFSFIYNETNEVNIKKYGKPFSFSSHECLYQKLREIEDKCKKDLGV